MNNRSKIKKLENAGYTIIETMIAVSLFLVIVMAGMGALLNANLLHQKSQDMRSIMDNLNFIMEDMSRNLRTGYNYHCVSSNDDLIDPAVGAPKSGSDCFGVAFESATGDSTVDDGDQINNNDQWVYRIAVAGSLWKSTQGPYDSLSVNYVQLTPEEVEIDSATSGFSVLGAEPFSAGDNQQPFVTIRLAGKITFKNIETPFSLQTSVSQRSIDK